MKLGHTADEIKYHETHGTVAIYLVILEGVPVMRITCDTADAKKTIRIVTPGPNGPGAQDTAGRFTTITDLLEDPDGNPIGTAERVNEKSVYTYVVPRLHVLLARLLREAANLS